MPEHDAFIEPLNVPTSSASNGAGGGMPDLRTLASRSNLTRSQLLLWMGQALNPEAPLYNMVLTFTLNGPVEPDHFQRAFRALLDRSDALRTVIRTDGDGVPQRRVLDALDYTVDIIDWTEHEGGDETLNEALRARARRQLDPSEPMFDTVLVRLGPERYVWYLNQHHLITDAWSTALVYRHVADLYARSLEGTLDEASDLPAYAAYADYERSFEDSALFRKTQDYWARKLNVAMEPVALYGKSAAGDTAHTTRLTHDVGHARSQRLRALAAEKDVRALTPDLSLFNVFATLLFAYLYRVSGQRRLAFGTPSHNRPTKAFKETIGVFIEVFPFQVEVEDGETFISLLGKVKKETHNFLRYAQPGTSSSALNRGFNVLLNFIQASFPSFSGVPMTSEWVHPGHGDPRHHLRLQVHDFDEAGRFVLHFDFNSDLFSDRERHTAASHFMRLVDGLIEDRTQAIDAVDLVADDERERLLSAVAQEPYTYGGAPTVVEAFRQQVARTPDAIAVQGGDASLTYRALDQRTTRLARRLRVEGVESGSLVGLCMGRSVDTVVALLAVLKASGAYVPIDPSHPAERIAYMLDQAQATVLLTHTDTLDRVPGYGGRTLCLDAEGLLREAEGSDEAWPAPSPDDAAYVIYTSGSTGQPKGVVVEHEALAHYAQWAASFYGEGRATSFPFFTPLAFDLTVTSVVVPLLTGGRIVVYAETGTRADLALLHVLDDDAVDAIKLTPSHLALIQHRDLSTSRVKTLILGGEDLKTDTAASVVRAFGGDVTLYNEYGPTEATVGCTVHRYDPAQDRGGSVPIGRPTAAARMYVLDEDGRLAPTGTLGEICVGGPGLARGYHRQPDRTADRFQPDPFRPGERIYRTGDVGRWHADGTLHYLGRTDHQVKIRGVRIEPGEIEAALLAHPAIDTVVVDVVTRARPAEGSVLHCTRCGLPSNYPEATYDDAGVCHLCRAFDTYAEKARQYFGTLDGLRARLDDARRRKTGTYDCMMLLSGGKDSSYALCQLVEMGYDVLAFTLDNGYISEEAKDNIRRVTEHLGVDHTFATTPAMNAIFVDSLERHSNVCNGCFKALYTLSMKKARDEGIPCIVTGLSRGQFFETRLTEELFWSDAIDVDEIDAVILEARKAYHRVDDAVARLLDVEVFQQDAIFEEVQFVDFYRYCDVELDDMMAFLSEHAPWIRPSDTGRSTNCLINEVGIYLHKKQRGFHNYAFPYSWDVRMGHKTRDEALKELDDPIDPASVQAILDEIGYTADDVSEEGGEDRLAAYYVSTAPLSVSDLRAHLSRTLPDHYIPSHFVRLDALPLTANGKVDRAALPRPEAHRPELETTFTPPRTPSEQHLARIWAEVMRVDQVGIHDNFFDLGGDSIMAIQISARATEAGLSMVPGLLFDHQTVAELAEAVASGGDGQSVPVEPDDTTGLVPLTPIQHWFFEVDPSDPDHFNQYWAFEVAGDLNPDHLAKAVQHVIQHHDALRLRFMREAAGWQQRYAEEVEAVPVQSLDLSDLDAAEQEACLRSVVADAQKDLELARGPLLRVIHAALEARPDRLVVVAHHLCMDGLSWRILLSDLETAYRQIEQGDVLRLPRRTSSYKAWAQRLTERAQTKAVMNRADAWTLPDGAVCARLRQNESPAARATEATAETVSITLTAAETEALLHAGTVHRAQTDELLLAALGSVLTAYADAAGAGGRLRVDVEGHGREPVGAGMNVARTVGWFTAIYPVLLPLSPDTPDVLATLKADQRPLRNRRHEYGLLRYLCGDADVRQRMAALPDADVLFNYLGPLDERASASDWLRPHGALGLSRSGSMARRYALEVNAFIVGDRLHVEWSYTPALLPGATVRQMADAFTDTLDALASRPDAAHAPSPEDFPLANLNTQTMDKLSSLLRKADNR